MGKHSMLLASSLVISILAILIGSSFATAATIGAGTLPEGCKKSYCADTILDTDLGEECVPGIPSHDLDICSDGTIRTKNCGANCKWEYDPTSCPVCGDGNKQGNEKCDWGTNNGVSISTSISCSTGSLPTRYTCAKDCSGLVYQDQCPVCGNNIWDPSTEDCDYGTSGKVGAGASELVQCQGYAEKQLLTKDCGTNCKWKLQECPLQPVPPPCPDNKKRDAKGNCPGTCEVKPSVCEGNSIVTRTVCTDPSGTETSNSITSTVPCKSTEKCASVNGVPECVSTVCSGSVDVWTCSDWGAPVDNVCTRSCSLKYGECANTNPPPQLQKACPTVTEPEPPVTGNVLCKPNSVKPGSYWCSYTLCNQATELVCNSKGTAYDVTVAVKDGMCLNGCGASYTPCSSLGCGATNSQGTYCGDCQPVPSPTNDPCAGITDPDLSQACCVSKGYAWARSGETKQFSGFTSVGQWGCVGDDFGEYLRFRECDTGICATDAVDKAACASINSCVLNGKCFTRLDETVAKSPEVAALVLGCQGKDDDNCKLLKGLDEAEKKAKNAQSREEKRKIAKDEIAQKAAELKKRGVIKESGTAKEAKSILLCLPR